MSENDEGARIIIERESGGGFGTFLLGTLVGAGLALLFAPQSGEETQEEIRARAQRLREAAEDRVRDAQHNLEGRFSDARDSVQERVDTVREAVTAGREAAREAREDLEQKLDRSKAAARAGIEAAQDAAAKEMEEETEEA